MKITRHTARPFNAPATMRALFNSQNAPATMRASSNSCNAPATLPQVIQRPPYSQNQFNLVGNRRHLFLRSLFHCCIFGSILNYHRKDNYIDNLRLRRYWIRHRRVQYPFMFILMSFAHIHNNLIVIIFI